MSNIQKQHKISPAIAWLTIQKFIIFYCPLDGEHTILPGAFCIVIKKQLRYNIYVVEMIRKLDIKIRYYMRLRDDRDKG